MMRTKLFRSFLIVILAALVSGFIFQWLLIKDFGNYVTGVKEDQFRWVRTSLEGSYLDGQWDKRALSESIHWAMMLGLDLKVLDSQGREIMTSRMVLDSPSETMKHQMADLFHINPREGKYDRHLLYSKNQEVGTLVFRYLPKKEIIEKEITFKNRIQYFLYVSLFIAGFGAFILALLFSRYLSKPLTNLKQVAEKIAKGDFNVRIPLKPNHLPRTFFRKKTGKGSFSDEIAKLSETFNFMAASLQKEEELRKHLLSNITHELRTPLTIMKTHVEALADGVLTDHEKGLETIKNETEKLIKLVKGIEDITLAEAGFFKRTKETEINLKEFLSGLVNGMAPVAQERGLFIKMFKDVDLIVSTDAEKLETIIQNILSNALKFTDRGGIGINYGKEKETFFIEIKDSGKGIPGDKIPLLFNRFYRIDRSDSLGFGIGLAIVKEFVTTLGGTVEVESLVDQGTTFKIILPKS